MLVRGEKDPVPEPIPADVLQFGPLTAVGSSDEQAF
jgi:hypothetical protein